MPRARPSLNSASTTSSRAGPVAEEAPRAPRRQAALARSPAARRRRPSPRSRRADERAASPRAALHTPYPSSGIVRRCRPPRSSAPPATRARRRSTGSSRTPSSSWSRSAPTRSPARPASALDVRAERRPARVRPERGGARRRSGRRLPVPRPRGSGGSRPSGRAVVVDLSGAHRLATRRSTRRGTASSTRGRAPRRVELRRARAPPPTARLIANPGCYATAALLALRRSPTLIDPAGVVVDAKSGVSGAGRALKASSHAGFVLENLFAVPRRHAPARTRDRAGARLPGLLRPAPPARAARSARHLLRERGRRAA